MMFISSWLIYSHIFSSIGYPSMGYLLFYYWSVPVVYCYYWLPFFKGKAVSSVNFSISFSILGRYLHNSCEDSSIQGLVFTSISQRPKSPSMMKSYPNSSKQQFLPVFNFFLIDSKLWTTMSFILGTRSSLT
jgi:hypothetical protein